jgi:membrane protein required for beta-lactamase induction
MVFDLGPAGRWELWNAAILGTLLMSPFAVGAYFGLRSVLKGFRGGWASLAANLVLGVLAIGMPIGESLGG